MDRPRAVGAALAALVILAGCFGQTGDPSATSGTSSTSAAPATIKFDGQAALEFVKGLALQENGTPRFRMPGTPGQIEGARHLWQAMDVPGWSRHWQNFTGADYLRLDLSAVAAYGPDSTYCPAADLEALPSWPFHNLYALRPSATANAPLLLLGAHWDSQMHSDFDANLTRRSWPDPGANDGASGVGVLLQLMRQVSANNVALPFDLGIFLVDGEDGFFDCYPIAGSLYFAQHPPIDVDRFVLLDMVGDPNARFIREKRSQLSDAGMLDLLWRHGRAGEGAVHFTNTTRMVDDDHVAFLQAGIPAVDVIDAGHATATGFPPQWDTTQDTVDRLSARTLAIVGQALIDALRDPVLNGPWPPRSASP